MNNDIANVLVLARGYIRDPENWIKGRNALTPHNISVPYSDPEATKFCLFGAVCRAEHAIGHLDGHLGSPARQAVKNAIPPGYGFGITNFNDSYETTHADVIAVLDKAIEQNRSPKK